ncbi:MAG: hypothetical protein H6698_06395 [Myxococcales bacterium]|nr:hypothetical protein [Myxococcales bacterium]MCB9533936.1 hypothetical protein [Myxococcales bacterium]
MPGSTDADWLLHFEALAFAAFGQRMDVGGLPRWSNPETPGLRDGNHAAVPSASGLIPDQLVQVFDAQRRDGATCACIDVYGEVDDRDELCGSMGLRRESDADLAMVRYSRETTPAPLPVVSHIDRPAPPVIDIPAAEWVDAVADTRGGDLAGPDLDAARAQACMETARFYAIRIATRTVACVARYDWSGASQLAAHYVSPELRKSGFGMAVVQRATFGALNRVVFAVFPIDNAALMRVVRRGGGEVIDPNVRRRYIADWSRL